LKEYSRKIKELLV